MGYRIITVSREFGSGGRTVGKLVSEKLGVSFYDNELVTKIAEESGFAEGFIKKHSEETERGGNIFLGFNHWGGNYSCTLSDQLHFAQSKVVKDIAEKESCVIVGRCADYILRDRNDCLNVFIHAEKDFKKRRIVDLYGELSDTPEKRLFDKDKRRKAYYEYYTNRVWGMASNYHLCLDSGIIGVDRCADIICEIARGQEKAVTKSVRVQTNSQQFQSIRR